MLECLEIFYKALDSSYQLAKTIALQTEQQHFFN